MNGDANDRPYRPVLEALALLLEPGSVAELRGIGADGRIASGYFDDPALLAEKAEALDGAGGQSGIYVTLNPVNPALLARRANRVKARLGARDATTADGDILSRRWLPVDIDPVRPSGVSATGDEHGAACETTRAIRDALAAEGWPAPIVADSGNGGHLLYRVDLPNDGEATALVRGVLGALDARFSTDAAKVDTAIFNAGRIWKVYGTVSRKGDSTRDRPHRRSSVVSRPFELGVVPVDRLKALAGSLPPGPPSSTAPPAGPPGGFDLGAWLRGHGIAIATERPWQGGTLYTLAACPFSDAHTDGAYAIQFANGALHAGCKHDSCGGGTQRWQELRARFEPGYADRGTAPALALVNRTVSEEDEAGRAATSRQLVFLFDPEIHRETRASGLAWLEPAVATSFQNGDRGKALERPLVTTGAGPDDNESLNGGDTVENENPVFQDPETARSDQAPPDEAGERAASGIMENRKRDLEEISSDANSGASAPRASLSRGLSKPVSRAFPEYGSGNSIDSRQFVQAGGLEGGMCAAFGSARTRYRERRGERRLCRACFSRAVERERRRCPPLPAVIDPAALRRAGAAIRRCDVCGLEAAAWHGDLSRLCDACYRREVRRGLGRGEVAADGGSA